MHVPDEAHKAETSWSCINNEIIHHPEEVCFHRRTMWHEGSLETL